MLFPIIPANIVDVTHTDDVLLGGMMRAIRVYRGWTPQALADRAGVDVKTVRSLERAERWPQDTTRGKIEDALLIPAGAISMAREDPDYRQRFQQLLRSTRPSETRWLDPDDDLPPDHRNLNSDEIERNRRKLEDLVQRTTNEDTRKRAQRLLEAHQQPSAQRSAEEQELVEAYASWERVDRAGTTLTDDDRPLIDLVDAGRRLAAMKSDPDVNGYVRKVESVAVGIMGFDKLQAGLNSNLTERTGARAKRLGLLEEFGAEYDRLRSSGIEGYAMLTRLEDWLDAAEQATGLTLTDPPSPNVYGLAAREEDDPKEDYPSE